MKKELLHLQDVNKSNQSHEVFHNLSFDVFAGESVGVLIPPLSGKTTLTRILQGDEDYNGSIFFGGELVKDSLRKFNAKREILCLTHKPPLIPNLTIGENMFLLPGKRRRRFLNSRQDDSTAQTYLDELGVSISATEQIRNTDIYTQHMVQLAQALQLDLKLVVFDDPSVYYDQQRMKDIRRVLTLLHQRGVAVLWLAAAAFPFPIEMLDRVVLIEDYHKVRTVFHPEQTKETEPFSATEDRPLLSEVQPRRSVSPALIMEGVSGAGIEPIRLSVEKGAALGLWAEKIRTLQRFTSLFIPNESENLKGCFYIDGKLRSGPELLADFGARYMVIGDSFGYDLLLRNQSILENVYLPVSRSREMNPLSINHGFQRALKQEIEERLGISATEQEEPASILTLPQAQELILFRIELQRPSFVIYSSSYSQLNAILQERLEEYFRRYLKAGISLIIASPGLDRWSSLLSGECEIRLSS